MDQLGFRLVAFLRDLELPVVAVAKEIKPEWARNARERGATIIEGEPQDAGLLELAGLSNASSLGLP